MSIIAVSSPPQMPSTCGGFARQSPLVKSHNASPLSPPMSSASTSAGSSLQNSPRDYCSKDTSKVVPSRSPAPSYMNCNQLAPFHRSNSAQAPQRISSFPVNEPNSFSSPADGSRTVMTQGGSSGRMVVIGMSSSTEHSRRQKRSRSSPRQTEAEKTAEIDALFKSPRTPRERKGTTYYAKGSVDLENQLNLSRACSTPRPNRRSHGTTAVAEAVRARLVRREQCDNTQQQQQQLIPAIHSFDASYFHSPPVISGSQPGISHSFSLASQQSVKFRRSVMVTEVPDIAEISAPSTAYLKRYTKCIKAQDGKTRGKMRPKSSQASRGAARSDDGGR